MTTTTATISPDQARADAKLTEILENAVFSCWEEIDRINSGQSSRRDSITVMRQLAHELSNQARIISHIIEGSR